MEWSSRLLVVEGDTLVIERLPEVAADHLDPLGADIGHHVVQRGRQHDRPNAGIGRPVGPGPGLENQVGVVLDLDLRGFRNPGLELQVPVEASTCARRVRSAMLTVLMTVLLSG
jgi:hypothetical protein